MISDQDPPRKVGDPPLKWRRGNWVAMLSYEKYGQHFSVSAKGRKPTNAEVDEAFAAYRFGLWIEEHLTETPGPGLNPWVRHFVPDRVAR